MARVKLDRIDRRILHDLQANGRMTNVDLAENAGISAPPCLRRVRALEEGGFIRGYHAQVDPEKLGFEAVFYALIGLESQAAEVLAGFERTIADWPEVRECHMVRGGGDFLLRIVAHSTSHENALTARLTGTAHVVRVTTFPVIHSSKSEAGVPIDLD